METRVEPKEHHVQQELCMTRAPYRQGREFKAVKVYTINEESVHLIVQNVPAIGLSKELETLFRKTGAQVEIIEQINDYPVMEEFTHTFHLKLNNLKQSKDAKKKLDNLSFYGSVLHICYAPELETMQETRLKLIQRESFVQSYASVTTSSPSEPGSSAGPSGPKKQFQPSH